MDTLTHALAGGVFGRAASARAARAAFFAGAAAGILPDLDVIFIHSRLEYVSLHRGVTHSFLLAPLLALGVAFAGHFFTKRVGVLALFGWALGGLLLHIAFDWINSYGTMFFAPLSWKRYQLDWIFILDPFLTGILLVALLFAALFPGRGRAMAAAGGVLVLGYLALAAGSHHRALELWRRELHPAGSVLAALPQPLSPFRWMLVADAGEAVEVAYVDIGPFAKDRSPRPVPRSFRELLRALPSYYAPPGRVPVERFVSRDGDRYARVARAHPDVAMFLRFARFPVTRVQSLGPGRIEVTFEDVRFSGPWRRNFFVYRALLNEEGRLLETGFLDGAR